MVTEKEVDDQLANHSAVSSSTSLPWLRASFRGQTIYCNFLEGMNIRVAKNIDLGDVASGLRVFLEQLKSKSGSFDEYVQQIEAIERQVTEFEAVIAMLDEYVSLLESKVQSVYQWPPP